MKVYVKRTTKRVVTMTVDKSGALQVVANARLSMERVKQIVEQERDWIAKQLAKRKCRSKTLEENDLPEGCSMDGEGEVADMFSGKKCLLNGDVFEVRPTVESRPYLDGENVYIPEKYYKNRDARLHALKSYIKKLAESCVAEEISQFGANVSLCPTRIEFRNLPNGWVRCSRPSKKIISLDYRVFQLPQKVRRYVIVHAFTHFSNEGHDKEFWNAVSNYLPHFRSAYEELKKYSFLKEI